MTKVDQFRVLGQLLKRDWYVLRRSIVDKIINCLIWAVVIFFMETYLTPSVGMDNKFGVFIFAGGIVANLLSQSMTDVAHLVDDFSGNKTITYYLTLPLPAWLIMLRYALSTALKGFILIAITFPVAYIILGAQFALLTINWFYFLPMVVVQGLFWGYTSLWVSSWMRHMGEYENVWSRITFPFWFLGCYMFTWAAAFNKFKLLGYLMLANPVTYAMEGMRAAVLANVVPTLNFWVCLFVLIICTMLFSWLSYRTMKRRLDFV